MVRACYGSPGRATGLGTSWQDYLPLLPRRLGWTMSAMIAIAHDRQLLGVLAVYAVVVFSGLKSFALWDQVRLLLDAVPWR